MATKKTRKRATHVPAPPANRPTLRFTDEEIETLQADMASVGGIPVSLGKYAHHATMQYAKLRKLETVVRRLSEGGDEIGDAAHIALAAAGF